MIYTLTNPRFLALTAGTSQLEQVCVGKTGQALKFAAGALSADKEVVIAAATKYGCLPARTMDARIEIGCKWDDKYSALASVMRGESLESVTEALRADKEVVLAAVKRNRTALDFERNGTGLEFASSALQANKEVVIAAVKNWGCALYYAADALKADKDVILAAVKQNGGALEFASSELQADKEVVIAAVKNWGCALYYAAAALKDDRDLVLAAVKQNGHVLAYASKALKADKDMVLAAVTQWGCALQFAAGVLQADKEVVLAAVKTDACALNHAAGVLQADKEVVIAAVKNGWVLRYAADALKSDALLLRLAELPNRGRRNLHIFKVKFAIRAVVAYWSVLAGKDQAHFDEEGRAVMQGTGALAAIRTFENIM